MKLAFSILLVFASSAQSRLITISYEQGGDKGANFVRSIFIEKYSIPKSLISLKWKDKCENSLNISFELCVDKKKALNIVSADDIHLIRKSVLSFSKKMETRNDF
jgi:hypothetical protein